MAHLAGPPPRSSWNTLLGRGMSRTTLLKLLPPWPNPRLAEGKWMDRWMCVHVCVRACVWKRQGWSVLPDLSQPCLPVCAVVRGLLWLVRITNHKFFLPKRLQLCRTVCQSSMRAVSFLLLQLSTEQNEARDANNERDSPQAQSQTQVCYPEKLRCK